MRLWPSILPAGRSAARAHPARDDAGRARAIAQALADDIDAQAILWHVRLRDRRSDDRAAVAAWLAEDHRHQAAFDAIDTGDARAPEPVAMPSGRWSPQAARWGAGGAIAASLAILVTMGTMRRADPYDVLTAPGGRQVVRLDGSTRVTLNGGTHMRFDRRDPRVATLLAGEALFQVRHDAARPFRLAVAGREIEDAGTVFNVVRDQGGVRVAVADGSVVYDPARGRIVLGAGQALADRGGGTALLRTVVQPDTVGGWRRGQLAYAAAPLSEVASDLARALGVRIVAAPSIAGRPFSGAIDLGGQPGRDAAASLARLMPALGLQAERRRDGYVMTPGGGAGS